VNEDEGREQSDAPTSQGMPRIAGKDQKLGYGKEQSLPERRQKGTNPADTMTLDF